MDAFENAQRFILAWRQTNNTFTNHVSLNCIKSFANCVMEFDQFYFLAKSKYVAGYEKVGEVECGDEDGYMVRMTLTDGSGMEVVVKEDSFWEALGGIL